MWRPLPIPGENLGSGGTGREATTERKHGKKEERGEREREKASGSLSHLSSVPRDLFQGEEAGKLSGGVRYPPKRRRKISKGDKYQVEDGKRTRSCFG